MELSSFFRGRAGSTGQASQADLPAGVITAADSAARLAVLDDFEQAAIVWIWATDADNRLIYISESAAEKLERPPLDLLGHPLIDLVETDPDNPDERSDRPLKFQLSARNKLNGLVMRFIANRDTGTERRTWWLFSGHPKFDKGGKFKGYRGSARDVTVEYERKLEDSRLAEYDSLTGLANRHRMGRRLESILSAYKQAKRSCALMMLDLDRFKQVNDTMGHQAGDELLRQVADRLKAIIGDRGEIGRLGGDEFQVILPDLDDRGKLGELAGKVIQIISQPYPIDGKRAIIGTSIGVAVAPYDGLEKDEMIRASDLALYAAKKGGRGQFRFFSADLKDEEEERALLLEDLREALANDQLELHYQPVVRTADNVVVGFEALMRWEHAERGFVSPAVFIPAAEESNLINQLGEWALKTACKAATSWPNTVRVAVNVSAVQFGSPALPDIVVQALAASGLEPNRLELELTESVFMGDSETVDGTFKALKVLGSRQALDDVGSG
jgi:diguanylate cyclase (GGDEF)-like protein